MKFKVASLAILILTLSGCGKLDPIVISGIRLASASSLERAKMMDEYVKANPNSYLQTHSEGLNAQAAAFDNMVKEIDLTRGKLSKTGQKVLLDMADTAVARASNFAMWLSKETDPPDVLKAHADALKKQGELLLLIKTKLVTSELEK